MSEPDTAKEDAAPPKPKLIIRYSADSYGRCRHTALDLDAVKPGDIGGLYAAISDAISADLTRMRLERKASSKTKVLSMGSSGSDQPLESLNCDIKIDLCRLLDKGKLILPPLGDSTLVEVNEDTNKRMDFIEFLMKDGVRDGDGWGNQILEGLCFEEGTRWPWYCLRVSYMHGLYPLLLPPPLFLGLGNCSREIEARLDKILKFHSRLDAAGIDPQTFFPAPPPPPPAPSPPAAAEQEVKVRAKTGGPAARPARKVEQARVKSKSAFTMKSLIGGGS